MTMKIFIVKNDSINLEKQFSGLILIDFNLSPAIAIVITIPNESYLTSIKTLFNIKPKI